MSTLTQLKYLAAYYVRHHVSGYEGLDEEFIDSAANEILDNMPTAKLEDIRRFMVAGNVDDWVPLGRAIDAALNPSPDTVWTPNGTVDLERDGSIAAVYLDGERIAMLYTEGHPYSGVLVARVGAYGEQHYAVSVREACKQVTFLYVLNNGGTPKGE